MAVNVFEMTAAAMTGPKPVIRAPFVAQQTITAGGTSTQTNSALKGNFITVQNTGGATVFIRIDTNPTAITGTDFAIGAGESMDFEVTPGHKLAAIT